MKIARVAVLGVAGVSGLIAAVIAVHLASPPPAPHVVAAPAPAPVPASAVLVATKDIPIGGKVTADAMRWQDWPSSDMAGNFIARNGDGSGQTQPLIGAIARASIYAGEPITEAKLIHSDRGFMSAILPQGMRAVALRISADTSAGGFILPNDRVDVIMTRKAPNPQANAGNDFLTETILNNVRVLAIDQTIENAQANSSSTKNNDSGQTVIGQTATLELTPQQSQIIAVAQQMADQGGGKLTLALRSVADSRTSPSDAAADATHLIGGTKKNGAITVVRDGVATDVSTIR
jgi:pilus assembly protein CpaB